MNTLLKPKSPKSVAARKKQEKEFVSLDGLLTVEDWEALPDTKPRYELIDGKLVQKPMTKRKHSQAAGQLLISLGVWARESGWQFFPEGTGVYINPHRGFVPDVIGFEPHVVLNPDESVGGAPFLVVEVLSDSSVKRDREEKGRGYASIGVQLYLIVDPHQRLIEVYRLQNGAYGAPEKLSGDDIWQPAELSGLRLELVYLWM